MKYEEHVLAVVVSGLTTNIAVLGVKKKGFDLVFQLDYNTIKIWHFHELIENTIQVAMENSGIKIKTACIAAPGRIDFSRDSIRIDFLEHTISRRGLIEKTSLKDVHLLNDFEALAYGIECIHESDIIKLPHIAGHLTPHKVDDQTIAVIGIHLSLGMAIARYDGGRKRHFPFPSDGEGMGIAARGKLEQGLVELMTRRSPDRHHPTYEELLSLEGVGILFNYISSLKGYSGAKTVRSIRRMKGLDKLAAIQANYHLSKACRQTLDMLVRFYARVCQNLALVSKCYSGLYVTNISVLKNTKNMEDKNRMLQQFMEEFVDHGSKSEMLRKIPVYIILNKNTALYGCANYTTF